MARLPRLSDVLTTANLMCGVVASYMALQGELTIACWLLFLAALFDVFDGLAARAMGGGSELGKQLDSLADLVSFGVAPGFIVYSTVGAFLTSTVMAQGRGVDVLGAAGYYWVQLPALALSLVIPVAAAWRLAKFNIDPRQSHGFLGLPTPANALFWAGLVLGMAHRPQLLPAYPSTGFHLYWWVLVALVPILSVLMLSEVPLPSLKFRHKRVQGNEAVIALAVTGLVLVMAFGFLAVPLLVILYLLSPLWGKLFPQPE
ncbi:MAG TPA: CDP-alcohol phosphatidyltransferase family protein [Flavobacteriales bacterium]|nr:CDP-alcohol phosphatidyltransferase family protein [Flavobacteriales bacterium]